ncbi:hypothetical protein Gogos_017774, partial [Gossypium gossypioides]|nr:hypothetical protein [Gossypium gossypioides]
SLFAPSPDFCFTGVAIVSNYNRFHQQVQFSIFLCYYSAWNVLEVFQAASIASKFARGMFSDLGSNQSCSGLSD